MTEGAIMIMLKERFADSEYVLIPQARNGTGFARSPRTADAVAMSLYPSRGVHLHGFEIKVARGDWKKELADPGKAEAICKFCDYWWIVAPEGVVFEEELPPTWGLLIAKASINKIAVKRQAPKLDPIPMDNLFIAALLRAAYKATSSQDEVKLASDRGYQRGLKDGREQQGYDTKRAHEELERLQNTVRRFESESGLNLHLAEYNLGNVRKTFDFIRNGGIDGNREVINKLADTAERVAKSIRELTHVPDAGLPVQTMVANE